MPDIKRYIPQRHIMEDIGGACYQIYDFAVHGGAIGTVNHQLTLPNNAIVTGGYIHVLTAVTAVGAATVSVGFNTTTDLLAATGKATFSANALIPLLPGTVNAASTSTTEPLALSPLRLTAERNLKVAIATDALTAGKFAVYVEYIGPFDQVQPVTYGK